MIQAVTIARQFGSGGLTVANMIAQCLNWRVLDREIVDEVVRMAGIDPETAERCDEHLDPVFHRLLKSLWQGGFERSTTQITARMFDAREMTRCARIVIEEAANQGGCVIVGRGGQCLLAGRSDVLHVFLWAPRQQRLNRIRERLPAEPDPERLMDRVDHQRIGFLRQEFNATWNDHRLYDLVVNTALGDETAVQAILSIIRAENHG